MESAWLGGFRLDKSTHREGAEVDSRDAIVLIIDRFVLSAGVGIRFAKGVAQLSCSSIEAGSPEKTKPE